MKVINISTTLSLSISFFILCDLILNVSTAEIVIDVGKNNAIAFTPQTVTANVGDKVTWKWHGTQYTVTEADSQGTCTKSTKLNYFDFTEKDNNKVQSFIIPANSPKRLFYFDKNNCAKGMYGVININSIISSPTKNPVPTTSNKPKDSKTSTTSTSSSTTSAESPTNLLPGDPLGVKSSSNNLSLIIVLAAGGSLLGLVAFCAGFMVCHHSTKNSGQSRMSNVGMGGVADVDAEPPMSSSHIEIINENSFLRPTSSISSNRGLLVPFDVPRRQSGSNSSSSDSPITTPSRNQSPTLSPTLTRQISNLSLPSPFGNSRRGSADSRSPSPTLTRQISNLSLPSPFGNSRRGSADSRNPSPTLTRQISNLSLPPHSPFGDSVWDSIDSKQDAEITLSLRSPSPTPMRQESNLTSPPHSAFGNSNLKQNAEITIPLSLSPTPIRQVLNLTPPPYSPVINSGRGGDNSGEDAEIARSPSPTPPQQVSNLTPPPHSPIINSRWSSGNSSQDTEITVSSRSPSPIPIRQVSNLPSPQQVSNLTPPPHSPVMNSRRNSDNSNQDVEIARSPSPTPMRQVSNLTPPLQRVSNLTPPLQRVSNLTPPLQRVSNLTPPPHSPIINSRRISGNPRQDAEIAIPLRSPSPIPMRQVSNLPPPTRNSRQSSDDSRQNTEVAMPLRNPSPTPMRQISSLSPPPHIRNSRQGNGNSRQDAEITIPLRNPSLIPVRQLSNSPIRNSRQGNGDTAIPLRIPSPTPMRQVLNSPPPSHSPVGSSKWGSGDSRQDDKITMESSNNKVLGYSRAVETRDSENNGTGSSRKDIKTQSSTEFLVPSVQVFPVLVTGENDGNRKVESDSKMARRLTARKNIFQEDIDQ